MATLRALQTSAGMSKAQASAADYYQTEIVAWEKTSMNNGMKNAEEIVAAFRSHSAADTNAKVLLEDARKY